MSLIGKAISGAVVAGAIGLVAAANAAAPSPTTRPPAAATTPPAATAKPPTTTTPPAAAAKPPTTAPTLQPPTATATPAKPPTAVLPTLPSIAKPATPVDPAGPALPDISEARLALAKQVMKVAPAVGDFNGILPDLMQDTKSRLINGRPDMYKQISVIVEATASSLVPRRNDLDADVARVWARSFTDDELKVIQAFFASPTGQKYKSIAPQVGNDIVKAGQNWADRVAGEMYDKSLAELQKQIK
jgi:hypothetical protein